MKDLLSKTDKVSLEEKTEIQLREIIKKEFSITRGISRMLKQELLDLIEEQRQTTTASPTQFIYLDENKLEVKVNEFNDVDGKATTVNVDGHVSIVDTETLQKMVYSEFSNQPTKVKENKVFDFKYIDDVDAAYLEVKTKVANAFGYINASDIAGTVGEDQVIEVSSKEFTRIYGHASFVDAKNKLTHKATLGKAAAKVNNTKAPSANNPKNATKSDVVREIIKKFKDSDKPFTSGDVMKEFVAQRPGEDIHRSFVSTLIQKSKKEAVPTEQVVEEQVIEEQTESVEEADQTEQQIEE